jgi:hypothetical protein
MLAIGFSTMLGLSTATAYASDKGDEAKCDHASPQALTVKVILGDKDKPPMAQPENAVACYQDDVDFVIQGKEQPELEIAFKNLSPFNKNLHGKGKTPPAKVNVNPAEETSYEYKILVEGYPVGDPYITIRPR